MAEIGQFGKLQGDHYEGQFEGQALQTLLFD
jgi:hypothetical protein